MSKGNSGNEFHVMEVGEDKFMVVNNGMRKEYNKRMPKGSRKVSIKDMRRAAVYSTKS